MNNQNHYQQKMENLAHIYSINDIYVFGSRAEEILSLVYTMKITSSKPGSDIDIGIYLDRKTSLTAHQRAELSIAFEDIFGSCVDMVLLNEADYNLALEIIKGELLYSADPASQAEYELYVLRRAGDLEYFERERRKMILGG